MSSKDKKLLIILAGIIVIAASYFFVLKPTLDKNAILESENMQLNEKFVALQQEVVKEEEYRNETKRMISEVDQILASFPSSLRIENGIMEVVYLEKATESKISVFSVADPVLVSVGTTEGDESVASAASQYYLYDVSTNLTYATTYKGMKSLINEIVDDKDKRSITSMAISMDRSTGELSGSLGFESYFVFGQEKDYEKANIPAIKHGTSNIFGSLEGN